MAFQFNGQVPRNAVLQAVVPSGIATEQELFDALYERLRLPEYFGDNWNALEECVRDFSWLPSGSVAIMHEDVPLVHNLAALGIYLSILEGAIEKWEVTENRRLLVIFPEETEGTIRSALALRPPGSA